MNFGAIGESTGKGAQVSLLAEGVAERCGERGGDAGCYVARMSLSCKKSLYSRPESPGLVRRWYPLFHRRHATRITEPGLCAHRSRKSLRRCCAHKLSWWERPVSESSPGPTGQPHLLLHMLRRHDHSPAVSLGQMAFAWPVP